MKTDLLHKIEELFWENSFAELSMDEIGKNLGIKKSSLYYHFPSKDQMFIETLEYSYSKYRGFLEETLIKEDVAEMISALINFPLKSKNLFSVVLQKGYCKNDNVKEYISSANVSTAKIFAETIGTRFGMSNERIILFRSVIDDLGKKNCTMGCGNSADFEGVVREMIRIFIG